MAVASFRSNPSPRSPSIARAWTAGSTCRRRAIRSPPTRSAVHTDANGYYDTLDGEWSANLIPGSYEAAFSPDGWDIDDPQYYYEAKPAVVTAGGTTTVDFTVRQRPTVTFTVLDTTGKPLAHAPLLFKVRNDGGACSVFHSHAVNAKVALGEFDIKTADPGASTFRLEVSAAGLDPDDPALRRELLGDGEEGNPISEGDRNSIRGSVAEEVVANENSTLTFVISGLTSTEGAGTATMR